VAVNDGGSIEELVGCDISTEKNERLYVFVVVVVPSRSGLSIAGT
jgi:hypothetical protein